MKLGHVATGNCPHTERSSIFRWKMTQRRRADRKVANGRAKTNARWWRQKWKTTLLVHPLHDELCAPTASTPENSSVTESQLVNVALYCHFSCNICHLLSCMSRFYSINPLLFMSSFTTRFFFLVVLWSHWGSMEYYYLILYWRRVLILFYGFQ